MTTLTPAIPEHAVPDGDARDDADEFVSEDVACSSPYVPATFTDALDCGYRAVEQVIRALALMPGVDTMGFTVAAYLQSPLDPVTLPCGCPRGAGGDLPSGNLVHPHNVHHVRLMAPGPHTREAATAPSRQKPLSSVSGRFWPETFTSLSTGRHTVTYPKIRLYSSNQDR